MPRPTRREIAIPRSSLLIEPIPDPDSATLKLAPLLPSKVAVVNFDTGVEAAVSAATEVVTAGLPVRELRISPEKNDPLNHTVTG
jgi:hypothetical protein